MARTKKIPIGADGERMTVWQIWLRRLCVVMIAWAGLELLVGAFFLVSMLFIPIEALESIEGYTDLAPQDAYALLGISSLVGAFLNVVIAFLGIRGSENPTRITVFFWIALIDAVITAWALVGNISNGVFDPAGIVSGLFIIALATCAWQVRKQTGYFDRHP